ncbi:MAG TPA: EamA family transporter RarD [Bacillaceae bacterium]
MKQGEKEGILYAGIAYILWGILTIYWKQIEHVAASEILANRIFWSFWFMLLVLLAGRKWNRFLESLVFMKHHPKTFAALTAASLLVSCNWFIYIWAVNSNKIVEASLGYYINPLVSILLGVIFIKEKLTRVQIGAFMLAMIGVLIMTLSYGQFPWIAFGVAITFGFYGLVKKLVQVDSAIGLTLETMIIMPVSFIYMLFLFKQEKLALFTASLSTDLLLIASGAITAIPLLYFAKGVQKVPLYIIGFMQYLTPTMTLLIGVLMYGEPFGTGKFVAFSFIWSALAILTLSSVKWSKFKGRKPRGRMAQ